MNSLAHNRTVCFIALTATIIFSLGTCSGYLFAADVTDMVEEEAVVEEAPVGVEAEESTIAEAAPAEEPTGEGETPAGEEDGFWDGPWPWILGGAVVVGGGVGIAVAASGGGGGGGDDDYSAVGTWNVTYDWLCDGTVGYVTWYIHEGGTYTTSAGSPGTWTLSGNTFRLVVTAYGTVYSGTMTSNNYMEGTMIGGTNGTTGCWSARRTGTGGMRLKLEVNMKDQTTMDYMGVTR